MGQLLIGCSGYSYSDWIGPFYPEGTSKNDFLDYYSRQFSFTELNFSYYRMPAARQMNSMLEKVPEKFYFAIKAHSSLTHERKTDWPEKLKEFKEGIAPLAEKQRLAAVLLQFPYSFHKTKESALYLAKLLEAMQDLPLAVEFRNSEWANDKVVKDLGEFNTAFVNLDQPDLPKLIQPSAIVSSSDLAYLRFHGRNKKNWWTGDNASRYDYQYSVMELRDWVSRINQLLSKAAKVIISFNNHRKANAVKNARELLKILEEQRDKPDD